MMDLHGSSIGSVGTERLSVGGVGSFLVVGISREEEFLWKRSVSELFWLWVLITGVIYIPSCEPLFTKQACCL